MCHTVPEISESVQMETAKVSGCEKTTRAPTNSSDLRHGKLTVSSVLLLVRCVDVQTVTDIPRIENMGWGGGWGEQTQIHSAIKIRTSL